MQSYLQKLKAHFGKLVLIGSGVMAAGLLLLSLFSAQIITLFYNASFIEYEYVIQGFSMLYLLVFVGSKEVVI